MEFVTGAQKQIVSMSVCSCPLLPLTQHSDLLHTGTCPLFIMASLNNIMISFPLKLNFDLDRGVFPMVIQAVVDEGDGRSLELHYSEDNYLFS